MSAAQSSAEYSAQAVAQAKACGLSLFYERPRASQPMNVRSCTSVEQTADSHYNSEMNLFWGITHMRLRRLPLYAALLLLAACNLSSDTVPITGQPAPTSAPSAGSSTSDEPCIAFNNTDEELEINAPDDIGTVIGLLPPGEVIAVKDILQNEAAPWRMGWIVVSVPESGEDGYIDPNVINIAGDCTALWTPPTP